MMHLNGKAAMDAEYKSLLLNSTWELVSITSRAENNEVQASRQNPNQDGWDSKAVQSEAGCERLYPSAWISLQRNFQPCDQA
jgi:hypothetical protein